LTDGSLRVGVIGIGFGQRVHVPAFRAQRRCHVAAICASTPERAARAAERLGIERSSGDWRRLVDDPTLDAVSIATPPALQPEIASAAIEAGKAVFCEKPVATSEDAAWRLLDAAERCGVAHVVDFELPETQEFGRAREIVASGGIGALRHAVVSWHVETYAARMGLASSWKTRRADGGGVLLSFTSHSLHYLEWLLGPIRSVLATLFPSEPEAPGDAVCVLCLVLASGAPVSVAISSNAFLGSGHRIELYGEGGTLVLDNRTSDHARGFRLDYAARGASGLQTICPPREADGPDDDGRIEAVSRLVGRFVDWIDGGEPCTPSLREGARVQALLAAAERSSALGGWVEVPDTTRRAGARSAAAPERAVTGQGAAGEARR
jgi:predicted dehydrogenase